MVVVVFVYICVVAGAAIAAALIGAAIILGILGTVVVADLVANLSAMTFGWPSSHRG